MKLATWISYMYTLVRDLFYNSKQKKYFFDRSLTYSYQQDYISRDISYLFFTSQISFSNNVYGIICS